MVENFQSQSFIKNFKKKQKVKKLKNHEKKKNYTYTIPFEYYIE